MTSTAVFPRSGLLARAWSSNGSAPDIYDKETAVITSTTKGNRPQNAKKKAKENRKKPKARRGSSNPSISQAKVNNSIASSNMKLTKAEQDSVRNVAEIVVAHLRKDPILEAMLDQADIPRDKLLRMHSDRVRSLVAIFGEDVVMCNISVTRPSPDASYGFSILSNSDGRHWIEKVGSKAMSAPKLQPQDEIILINNTPVYQFKHNEVVSYISKTKSINMAVLRPTRCVPEHCRDGFLQLILEPVARKALSESLVFEDESKQVVIRGTDVVTHALQPGDNIKTVDSVTVDLTVAQGGTIDDIKSRIMHPTRLTLPIKMVIKRVGSKIVMSPPPPVRMRKKENNRQKSNEDKTKAPADTFDSLTGSSSDDLEDVKASRRVTVYAEDAQVPKSVSVLARLRGASTSVPHSFAVTAMDQTRAEIILRGHQDGAYLFRESHEKIVLSVIYNQKVSHHQLALPASISFRDLDKSLRKLVKQFSVRRAAFLPCVLKEYVTNYSSFGSAANQRNLNAISEEGSPTSVRYAPSVLIAEDFKQIDNGLHRSETMFERPAGIPGFGGAVHQNTMAMFSSFDPDHVHESQKPFDESEDSTKPDMPSKPSFLQIRDDHGESQVDEDGLPLVGVTPSPQPSPIAPPQRFSSFNDALKPSGPVEVIVNRDSTVSELDADRLLARASAQQQESTLSSLTRPELDRQGTPQTPDLNESLSSEEIMQRQMRLLNAREDSTDSLQFLDLDTLVITHAQDGSPKAITPEETSAASSEPTPQVVQVKNLMKSPEKQKDESTTLPSMLPTAVKKTEVKEEEEEEEKEEEEDGRTTPAPKPEEEQEIKLPARTEEVKGASAPTTTSTESETSSTKKKPRRKLVRGGNAIKTPVLPEYQMALDALDELDTFLNKYEEMYSEILNFDGPAAPPLEKSRSRIFPKLTGVTPSVRGSADFTTTPAEISSDTAGTSRQDRPRYGALFDMLY